MKDEKLKVIESLFFKISRDLNDGKLKEKDVVPLLTIINDGLRSKDKRLALFKI